MDQLLNLVHHSVLQRVIAMTTTKARLLGFAPSLNLPKRKLAMGGLAQILASLLYQIKETIIAIINFIFLMLYITITILNNDGF